MINAMKSAIGTAIKTPYNPKIQERIKINGINNKHCLNKLSLKEISTHCLTSNQW